MNASELEQVYGSLAEAIDRFDEAAAQVFLAKLALLMAERIGDAGVVQTCIEEAARSLRP